MELHEIDDEKSRIRGGGLISTTSDYINFCSMLLNGGLFNGNQIVSSNSIKKMTQNQIGPLTYPWGEGIKFGYGFYVVTDSQKSDLSDSNGSFGWIWSSRYTLFN